MSIEDKLEKIIKDIAEVNARLDRVQTETIFYNAEELAKVMKISKETAYCLMNSKGFPTQNIGKRKVVEATALQRWASIERYTSLYK
mgnify:CR=1 FL=1